MHLADGELRTCLQNGDTVTLTGYCQVLLRISTLRSGLMWSSGNARDRDRLDGLASQQEGGQWQSL